MASSTGDSFSPIPSIGPTNPPSMIPSTAPSPYYGVFDLKSVSPEGQIAVVSFIAMSAVFSVMGIVYALNQPKPKRRRRRRRREGVAYPTRHHPVPSFTNRNTNTNAHHGHLYDLNANVNINVHPINYMNSTQTSPENAITSAKDSAAISSSNVQLSPSPPSPPPQWNPSNLHKNDVRNTPITDNEINFSLNVLESSTVGDSLSDIGVKSMTSDEAIILALRETQHEYDDSDEGEENKNWEEESDDEDAESQNTGLTSILDRFT